jgi:CO dehydrogenase/acetyl-CoA synthase epsilon subunit
LHKVRIFLQKNIFLAVDDFTIPKRKYKKTQGVGVNYCASIKKSTRSHCIVSSSFLMGEIHHVFKSLFYVGKKYICLNDFKTKNELAIKLFNKFENYIFAQKGDIKKFIVLIDGGYTNTKVMSYINSSNLKGFIGRYSKGRKLVLGGKYLKLSEYISTLLLKDFKKIIINDIEKYVHEIVCDITGATAIKMLLVIDNMKEPKLSDIRPLVTNVLELSAEEIVKFFSKRWKEETYHQILKEGFGAKSHKLRTLKALSRFMELIAVSYTFCEIRRVKCREISVFEVKNKLISTANKNFILNMKGNKFKKPMQDKILKRFVA